jgi:hypothetical protein
MKKFVIAFSGFSKVGKDESSGVLVRECGAVHIGLADEAKRHMKSLYGFTSEQLWGPSEKRNEPHLDHIRTNIDGSPFLIDGKPAHLTPRYALQIYMEKMQEICINTWIDFGLKTAKKAIEESVTSIVTFSDFRHWHEVRRTKEIDWAIPILVRVRRPSIPNPPYNHRSETEQTTISDDIFDFVIQNDKSLPDLYLKITEMAKILESGKPPKTINL